MRPFQSAGFAALSCREMPVDLGAALVGEPPGLRRKRKLQPIEMDDGTRLAGRRRRGRHAVIVPCVTMTASPPIDAAASLPSRSVIARWIRLGRPIS